MISNVFKIEDDALILSNSPNDENSEYWIDLKYEDNESLSKKLLSLGLKKQTIQQIDSHELNETLLLDENLIVLRLMISSTSDIYRPDYLTIIRKQNLLITILNKENTLLDNFLVELNNNPFKLNRSIYYIVYYLTALLLQTSTKNLNQGRIMVDKLQSKLDLKPEDVEIKDLIKAKQSISSLTNIIESQHISLELVPKINWKKDVNKVEIEIRKMIDRYTYIQNAANRLESKAKEMQLQYQLILQERGNKRLNTLTIIQSIFVPLTLISGVYGMNFLVMPELEWTNGYYVVLSTMAIIAIVELWIFRKNGWFD